MSGTLARAGGALRSRDFRFLLAGRLLNQVGDGFFQAYLVAQLVFLNPDEQGTALGIAVAYAIVVLPFSLLGPFAGVLIDRWSRRRILMFTPAVRASVVLALLALGAEGWPVLPAALLVASLNRFFLSSATAVVPLLVPDEDLLVANSMASVGGTVLTFTGIVAGTKLAGPIGTAGLLLVVAACWPAAGLATSRIRRDLRARPAGGPMGTEVRRIVRDLSSGLRRLTSTPGAIGPVATATLNQLLVGFVTVLSVVVFKDEFGEGIASYGNLIAAGGVGVLTGAVTVGMLEPRLSRARIISVAFAVAGIVCAAAAAFLNGATILAASFTLGLTFSWMKVPADTMVQESIPDRYRGRVFALYDIVYASVRVLAAALCVPLIPHVSTGWLLGAVGAVFLLWSPVLPRWVRRRPSVAVRFYAGGRAEETPRAIVVGGEEERVDVVASTLEERDGVRRRRFRLITEHGDRIEIVGDPDGGWWRLEREVPAEIAGAPEGS